MGEGVWILHILHHTTGNANAATGQIFGGAQRGVGVVFGIHCPNQGGEQAHIREVSHINMVEGKEHVRIVNARSKERMMKHSDTADGFLIARNHREAPTHIITGKARTGRLFFRRIIGILTQKKGLGFIH